MCSGLGNLRSASVGFVQCGRAASGLIIMCRGKGISVVCPSRDISGLGRLGSGGCDGLIVGGLSVGKGGTCVYAGFKVIALGARRRVFRGACSVNVGVLYYARSSGCVCTDKPTKLCEKTFSRGLLSGDG